MAKQRGVNRTIFISIFVILAIVGIVIGVLFATGVLGKKSSSSGSKPVPPTPAPPGPPSPSGTPTLFTDAPVITNVISAGSTNNQLNLEIEYLSSSTVPTDTGAYISVTVPIVPPPNSYWPTHFEGYSNSTTKISEGRYKSSFSLSLTKDPNSLPPGKYPGQVGIILCHSCNYSNDFSFTFENRTH